MQDFFSENRQLSEVSKGSFSALYQIILIVEVTTRILILFNTYTHTILTKANLSIHHPIKFSFNRVSKTNNLIIYTVSNTLLFFRDEHQICIYSISYADNI